jgi:hypothetical protein
MDREAEADADDGAASCIALSEAEAAAEGEAEADIDKGEVEVELEDAPPAVALAALMTIPVPRRVVSMRPNTGWGPGREMDSPHPTVWPSKVVVLVGSVVSPFGPAIYRPEISFCQFVVRFVKAAHGETCGPGGGGDVSA